MSIINIVLRGLSVFLLVTSAFAEVQITRQPISQEVPLGQSASFDVQAASAPGEALLYQWYFNDSAVIGATSATLIIQNVQSTNLGTYFARVGNLQATKETTHVELTATQGIISQIYPAVEVVFPTQIGKTYLLQTSTDLLTWLPSGQPIVANALSTSNLLSSRGNARTFYRVLQRLDGSAPSSPIGLSFTFRPAGAQSNQFLVSFNGAATAQSGTYVTTGSLNDTGSFTYSESEIAATVVFSSNNGGSATYTLDFAHLTYKKSYQGQIIETGLFSF